MVEGVCEAERLRTAGAAPDPAEVRARELRTADPVAVLALHGDTGATKRS